MNTIDFSIRSRMTRLHPVRGRIPALIAVCALAQGLLPARDFVVEKVADGFVSAEGPVWRPEGYLLFSDVHGGKIYRLAADGSSEVWFDKGIKTNGLVFSRDGKRLYACCYSERELIEIDPATRDFTVLTDRWNGREYNNVNDVALDDEGNVYFTDPKWGAGADDVQGVYCRSSDGTTTLAARLDRQPNGIVVSPDQRWVYVSRSGAREVMRFRRLPGGRLTDALSWARVEAEPDGMTIDRKGNLYVALAGNGKLCVLSPEGEVLALIPVVNRMATNCEFQGGDTGDQTILYVTGRETGKDNSGAIYRVILGDAFQNR